MKKRLWALLMAGVMVVSLAACGGKPSTDDTNPTPKPTTATQPDENPDPTPTPVPVDTTDMKFGEAPMLADQVKGGKLEAVEDRLPVKEDVKVEAVKADGSPLEIGVYGGELKTSAAGSSWTTGKIIEEGLFLFNTDGTLDANVAKGYEVSEDAKVWTIHLREGMRWSDGEPFTAEDCVWFYNAVCLNKVDSKGVRNCHKDADGNPAVVEKVDDYTFTVTFGTPKYDFLEALEVDLKWHWAPKHTFESIVQKIIDGDNEGALAEIKDKFGLEFADVGKAGKELLYYFWNYPGVPTLNSYVLSTEEGKNSIKGEYYEYVRNPYYWKVDAEGNQLPYIDKITYTAISNTDQSLLLLLDGSVDFQSVAMADISTIKESNTKINIYEWSGTSWGDVPTQLHFNMNFADANKKALFNNKDFRQGMSICVDREEFAGIYGDGWLEPGQAAPQPGMLGYSEEWAKKWTEYDVKEAKALFEKAGLVMGSDGFYDFADGTNFELNIISVADMGAADTYKVLETYFRAAGIKCTFRDYDRSNVDNMLMANEVECILYPITGLGDISIALKPNSMVPGYATNVAWYSTMTKETATGDLLKLIELKEQLDVTSDAEKRTEIQLEMLKLHEENMWVLAYVSAAPAYTAVNARIHNFLENGIATDIYRDMGIAHSWCWYISE